MANAEAQPMDVEEKPTEEKPPTEEIKTEEEAKPTEEAPATVEPAAVEAKPADTETKPPEKERSLFFHCTECGKEFGTEMGLRGHKRWCEGRGAKVEDAEFVGDGSGMSPQQQGWVTRRANASTGGSNPHMGRGARNAHKEVDPDEDIDDILVERTTRPRRSSASNLNRDDDIRPAKLAVASSGTTGARTSDRARQAKQLYSPDGRRVRRNSSAGLVNKKPKGTYDPIVPDEEDIHELTLKNEAKFEKKAQGLTAAKLIALLGSPQAYKRAICAQELTNQIETGKEGAKVAALVFETGTVQLLELLGQAGYEIVRENTCKLLITVTEKHPASRLALCRAGCLHVILPLLQVSNVVLNRLAKRLLFNLSPTAFKTASEGPLKPLLVANTPQSLAPETVQKGGKPSHNYFKEYATEVAQLMHAYGDVAKPLESSVFILAGIIRRWANQVYNTAQDSTRKSRKNVGKTWREHTGVSVEDVASLLPGLAARYRLGKQIRASGSLEDEPSNTSQQHITALVPSTSVRAALPNPSMLEQSYVDGVLARNGEVAQDTEFVERVLAQEKRHAAMSPGDAEYFAACREVSLAKNKKDRFRRFLGLRISNPKVVDILGFLAHEHVAAIVKAALKLREEEPGANMTAALKPDEILAVAKDAQAGLAVIEGGDDDDELIGRKRAYSEGNPYSKRFKEAPKREQEEEEYYCICRMPEFGFMLECEGCNEWFHGKCVGVTRRHDTENWRCPNCVKAEKDRKGEEEEEDAPQQGEQ